MGSHLGVKTATEPASRRGALRLGRRRHGTGLRFRDENDQVDAISRDILRVAEHEFTTVVLTQYCKEGSSDAERCLLYGWPCVGALRPYGPGLISKSIHFWF
jgi:hypothetical protein